MCILIDICYKCFGRKDLEPMTNEEFQRWLAGVEQLTVAQRERLQQVA